MDVLGTFLFFAEVYHTIAHVLVLTGLRLLPRKDLSRLQYYFVIDTATVCLTSFFYLRELQWLAVPQLIQHLFYVFTFEKSGPALKVISWSSLDWIKMRHSRWQWDLILGTSFDIMVHVVFSCLLFHHLTTVEVLVSVVAVCALLGAILFNKRYAWSNPYSGNVPQWVDKRCRPLPDHSAWWRDSPPQPVK